MLPIVKYILRQYKGCATKRGLAWKLSDSDFQRLIDEPCVYCGDVATNTAKRTQYAIATYVYNGIDRINSSQDYTISNCVSCCKACNAAKSDVPLHVFLSSEWLQDRLHRVNQLRELGRY